MLASRGPVYSTAKDAGRDHAGAVYTNNYHPGCDCLAVPVYDFADWPGREQWRELEKFYKKAIDEAEFERIRAKNEQLAAIDQFLRDGKSRASRTFGPLPAAKSVRKL